MNEKDNFKINKKQSTLMITLGITMLLMAIVGVTYAYFVVNLDFTPGSSINVEVGSFGDVAFVDGNQINLPGGYPGDILTKTFTVTRTNATDTTSINYKIMLYVRENTLTPVSNGYFTYTLSGVKTGKGTVVTASNVVVPTSTSQIGSNGEFTGNGVHTYTFSIGLKESNSDQRSTMARNFKGYLQVESIDTTYVLTNLIENGNFETDTTGWYASNFVRNNLQAKYGTYSLRNYQLGRYIGATLIGQKVIPNHQYYFSNWMYVVSNGSGTCYSDVNLTYDNTSHWLSSTGTQATLNTWLLRSRIYTIPDVLSPIFQPAVGKYNMADNAEECYIDGVMLIDLTAAFGEGNEPSKAWCDANIPFFEGSKGFNFYTHKDLILHYDAIDNTLDGHSNSTTTWYDLSGNGRNGTLSNFGSTSTSGWQNDSLAFDGANDYVTVPYNASLAPNEYTIELVVNKKGIFNSTRSIVFVKWPGYTIEFNANGTMVFGVNGSTQYLAANTLMNLNEYYVITATYGNNKQRMFINGTFETEKSDVTLSHSSNNLSIGYYPSSYYFNGNFYSVRMYNRALTDAEVQYNYSVDRNRFGLD